MANDYQGDVKNFAIVVPVPEVIEKDQVNVTENKIIDHLDAYSAPRLVEYHDDNPCRQRRRVEFSAASPDAMQAARKGGSREQRAKAHGVTIEEEYTVGEYDLAVLSAEQSDGLLTFLNQEGYKLPEGADDILESYIDQEMKFFLAKVNLKEFKSNAYSMLRPLQVAYESDKFMLPIRLGTLNARGPQELILFTLTRNGRVEPVNYRTVKIPTDKQVPLYVEDKFKSFYRDMFSRQVKQHDMEVAFLEYAWDMGNCDPCAADPLPPKQVRELGAWWIDGEQTRSGSRRRSQFAPSPRRRTQPVDAYVTRLHMRYTAESFPEDIILQETADDSNFQGRYVLRHPYTGGDATCEAAEEYYDDELPDRFEREAETLARLTGWKPGEIKATMAENGQPLDDTAEKLRGEKRKWWQDMWKNQ
jgi:hypothetical protein